MILAVRADRVPGGVHPAHRRGICVGHGADEEIRRLDALCGENIEDLLAVGRQRAIVEREHDLLVAQRHGLGVLHHAKAPVLAGLDGEHAARSKRVGIPRAILALRGRHRHKRSGSHAADSENQPP